MKKRIKSLDTFRGVCITWMIFGHVSEWWMSPQYFVLVHYVISLIDAIGATGFLFISGISLTLSYRNKISRIKNKDDQSYKRLKFNYFLRATFLFVVGVIYNIIDSVRANNIGLLWNWFILFTLPISIILAWPLQKYSKKTKIIVAIAIIFIDQLLFLLLYAFQTETGNFLGLVYFFLYNLPHLTPIIAYFPFYLIGTVMGDIIYESYIVQDDKNAYGDFFKRLLLMCFLVGITLIFIAIFIIPLPVIVKEFLWHRRNIAWIIYAIGILLSLYPALFYIKDIRMVKISEKYRFFYYFSYYSFSIFLIHYSLYFIFNHILNLILFIPAITITILLIGLGLRLIYLKLGGHFSLKYQLARLADGIVDKIIEP